MVPPFSGRWGERAWRLFEIHRGRTIDHIRGRSAWGNPPLNIYTYILIGRGVILAGAFSLQFKDE
jgi:hypothetical protein